VAEGWRGLWIVGGGMKAVFTDTSHLGSDADALVPAMYLAAGRSLVREGVVAAPVNDREQKARGGDVGMLKVMPDIYGPRSAGVTETDREVQEFAVVVGSGALLTPELAARAATYALQYDGGEDLKWSEVMAMCYVPAAYASTGAPRSDDGVPYFGSFGLGALVLDWKAGSNPLRSLGAGESLLSLAAVFVGIGHAIGRMPRGKRVSHIDLNKIGGYNLDYGRLIAIVNENVQPSKYTEQFVVRDEDNLLLKIEALGEDVAQLSNSSARLAMPALGIYYEVNALMVCLAAAFMEVEYETLSPRALSLVGYFQCACTQAAAKAGYDLAIQVDKTACRQVIPEIDEGLQQIGVVSRPLSGNTGDGL